MRSRALGGALLVLAYVALTVVFTYPLAFHLGTHHVGEGGGDAKIYLWSYWWTREALLERGANPFATDVIFHPIGIGLALHTLGFLQGVAFVPASFAFGDVAAANLVVLWSFLASALAAFLLARTAGAGPHGAFLAGMVFAFCPYRLARLSGHYDLLGTEWIALYATALVMLFRRDSFSLALAALAGALAAACGYTAASYLAFLGFFTALLLAFEWRRLPALLARTAAVGIVAAVLLAPWIVQLAVDRTSWTYPRYPGEDRYTADLTGPLLGWRFDENLTETTVFAGFFVLAAALAATVLRKRVPGLSFWLVGAAVFFVGSLGSSLRVAGVDTGIPLPFRLVSMLPLLDNLRAPSRLSILTMLCLAVVLALLWTRFVSRSPYRWLATPAAAALLTAEYVSAPVPLFASSVHPVYHELARTEDDLAVVEIPGIEQAPVETMYHQTFHEKPIVIGTAARVPREKSEYYFGLPLVRPLIDLRKGRIELDPGLVEREKESAPSVARFLGVGYFVLDRAYEKRGVVSFLEEVLPVERWYEDERLVVLRVRRDELPPSPRLLDPGAPESRQHFESGWDRPESEGGADFRWANRERSTVLFRRPSPSIDEVVVEIAPLEGSRQTVTASLDGVSLGSRALERGWQEVVFPLGTPAAEGAVERLSLRWSALERGSERDPRRLAARVRALRLE